MRIFIDTNIFLDILLRREAHKEALMILNAVSKGLYEAHILDITLLNIDYVAKKQVKDIRGFITAVNEAVTVSGADNAAISQALGIKNVDFEDNLQYVTAKQLECEAIITNDHSFYSPDTVVYDSKQFIERFIG